MVALPPEIRLRSAGFGGSPLRRLTSTSIPLVKLAASPIFRLIALTSALAKYPAPEGLCPRLPRPDEEPNRITCGGLGSAGASNMYWFVETITSRQLIEASAASQGVRLDVNSIS